MDAVFLLACAICMGVGIWGLTKKDAGEKRWKVEVWFNSPKIEPVKVKSRSFRFWIFAKIFAEENNLWDNWRQTRSVISDNRSNPA